MALEKPVLLLVYRRPDTTRKVFEAVRKAKPTKLYISASGPEDDSQLADCDETRAIFDEVDWNCDVHRNFWPDNHGCRINVARGITWALEHEEEIIILEDDCVPTPSFFRFCSELLDRYRDDERVMTISGTNFLLGRQVTDDSYYLTRYPNIWGWATWRRAWQFYDSDLELWFAARERGELSDLFGRRRTRAYWRMLMDFVANGKLDAWDYPWFASCWLQGGLSAQPTRNLVDNIGFDDRATHTTKKSNISQLHVSELTFPLQHPSSMIRNRAADLRIEQTVFSNIPNFLSMWFFHRLYSLPPGVIDRLKALSRVFAKS